MDLGLGGKTVLITGSGSGIGQHMAAAFAAEGAKVAVNDISQDGIDATLSQIAEASPPGAISRTPRPSPPWSVR
jgi:NAD(P)-dependent dehydrogenase (short-subunit alcohol dehydrogenase family)